MEVDSRLLIKEACIEEIGNRGGDFRIKVIERKISMVG
jgi:hypothetical protein